MPWGRVASLGSAVMGTQARVLEQWAHWMGGLQGHMHLWARGIAASWAG